MKKQDYAVLAQSFAVEKDAVLHAWYADEKNRTLTLESNARIARMFANRANVNKTEFLKACGIDP